MSMEMSKINRFIDSEQHANVDENVDFLENVEGNVENISTYKNPTSISTYCFRMTCKC
jgi:hypothetical protein